MWCPLCSSTTDDVLGWRDVSIGKELAFKSENLSSAHKARYGSTGL